MDQMKYIGIAKALSYGSSAKEDSAKIGNDALIKEISTFPELHSCWVLKPSYVEEMDEPKALVERMLEAGVLAGRMFPTPEDYGYFLAEWSMGGLLREMEAHRIPLFIDLSLFQEDDPDWRAIDDLCELHPDLPVVLGETRSYDNKLFYPFMRTHRNFHLELSSYYVHRGIEDICERFGADRLIFGSGMPLSPPGEIMAMVTQALIGPEERALVAGGNLENLLKNVAPGIEACAGRN
jgi:hypothetical protein